jgi:hypothetical protein
VGRGLVAAHEDAQRVPTDEAIGFENVERTDLAQELEQLGPADFIGRTADDDVEGRAQG